MAKKKATARAKKTSKPKRKMKASAVKPNRRAVAARAPRPKSARKRPTGRRESSPAAAPAKSKALAPGTQWINAYLTVRDVQAAIEFYQRGFGFEVRSTMPGPGGVILHAELMHNDSLLMLGPENPEMGAFAPQGGPSPITLYAYVDDVDDVASRASSNGARISQPPEDKFWGDRCCIIVDPQGHTWMIATHVRDVPPEEMIPPVPESVPTM